MFIGNCFIFKYKNKKLLLNVRIKINNECKFFFVVNSLIEFMLKILK